MDVCGRPAGRVLVSTGSAEFYSADVLARVRVRVRVRCGPMWSDAVISHTPPIRTTFMQRMKKMSKTAGDP